jgi:hypothetical protein
MKDKERCEGEKGHHYSLEPIKYVILIRQKQYYSTSKAILVPLFSLLLVLI